MKLLARLVVALVICMIAIPVMAIPALAADIGSMSLHPTSGAMGTEVYITGSSSDDSDYWVYYQIADDDWVEVLDKNDFDFDSVDVDDYDYETEKFDIPESYGGKHKIAICNDDPSNPDDDDIDDYKEYWKDFTVEPKVEITDPDDAEGAPRTEVTVKGTGFGEDEDDIEILFDGDVVSDEPFDADEYGTWEETFLVPAASRGSHDVSAEGDDTDESDVTEANFDVLPGISVEPLSGAFGDEITVTGSGFAKDETSIKILFDDEAVKSNITADEDGLWEGTFEVPEAAMGTYDVTAEGRTTKKRDIDAVEFEVLPGLVVTPLSGHVGTMISVSGGGFPASESVTVTYDGVNRGSGVTGSDGSFSDITFAATHTQSTHTADHPIVVTGGTSTFSKNFVMESVAPATPTLSSPVTGARIGYFMKVTPTLAWSAVTDDSGVTYDLQVGTDANFAQVLISKTGLTGESVLSTTGAQVGYTLTDAEALPHGTYYWRVKAVDGAQNASAWSAASFFKSGYVPFWAFIAIVAGLVVLIGAVVFLLVRRSAPYD